jgi:hypothetical protein
MAKTYVYSFQNLQATVNNLPVEGFWEGDDAISITPNSDNATPLVGVDGDATVSYSTDDSVRITMRLKADSPVNALLENYYRRARAGGFGGGFPVSVRNTGNGEGGSGAEAHIIQAPERQFGANATVRAWTLFVNAWTWNAISYQAP